MSELLPKLLVQEIAGRYDRHGPRAKWLAANGSLTQAGMRKQASMLLDAAESLTKVLRESDIVGSFALTANIAKQRGSIPADFGIVEWDADSARFMDQLQFLAVVAKLHLGEDDTKSGVALQWDLPKTKPESPYEGLVHATLLALWEANQKLNATELGLAVSVVDIVLGSIKGEVDPKGSRAAVTRWLKKHPKARSP